MTKRERFHAFAGFEPVDRVPRRAGYVEELRATMTGYLGEDPLTRFDIDGGLGRGLRPPDGYVPPDYSAYHVNPTTNCCRRLTHLPAAQLCRARPMPPEPLACGRLSPA